MTRSSMTILAFGFLSSLSCATQSSPPPATERPLIAAEPAAAAEEVVGPPKVAWADMTKEQKGKFMKHVVMPKMKPLFVAFDSEEFKEFTCKTCHGKDPKAVEFKMPSPDIFELPNSQPGFMALAEKKPKWMAFMKDTVKPQMAAVLNVKEMDPTNPAAGGFSCMSCHTMAK